MVTQEPLQIRTYEDLIIAKQFLKSEIKQQEAEFKNNPVVKISSSLFKGNSLKSKSNNPLASLASFSSGNYIKTAEKLLRTVLMTNKRTRGIFISFIIAKEMIPFTLQKINDLMGRK
ncbi:MAG: hypothetical protein OEM04_08425 [Flavobacteriaceae bacterium]|nr:hypothetical protein [Flavobacteriaceae bacterium]